MTTESCPVISCCEPFKESFENGTDNESWGAVLYVVEEGFPVGPYEKGEEPGLHFGNNLPPINFCPWCGKATQIKNAKGTDK